MSHSIPLNRRLSVAPMMDWTDRHFRYFLRLISSQTLLYTEMVHARAIVHGERERLIGFSPEEHPVALQLGGSDPAVLAEAAAIGEQWGYDEINLNVGCPSDRVQAGRFGACLMLEPQTVADCVSAMQSAVSIPVTVKCRIGVDDQDSEAELHAFLATVIEAGCQSFALHARKAWLNGLSPKQNREIPPLDYAMAGRMVEAFPGVEFIVNGGIRTLEESERFLDTFHGVMIGREACSNPWLLAAVDQRIFGQHTAPESRHAVAEAYAAYCERMGAQGVPKSVLLRNIHGLFQGIPGARQWRRSLSEPMATDLAPETIIRRALEAVPLVDAA
ncbi:tRNA dihydrouridine(20/20a) synthase DusA [Natronospira bacteriovora]|uniref:tRNA-dihydrouridine(20/20a) synthase n=1 Tax=Natronospira bacteriovora TaxID=3069753 RepID=A0ABU0W501_9GAMM|nr:tRNA dihydrouridine(20/20a) synthase DusA [Natronospira sp. AB-CW4]MDQ2069102.1 tRNA dihydrouridine(20/20a) synthase DusA [Natronospira sp. AB-CW4]